jgi:hypothetical protein
MATAKAYRHLGFKPKAIVGNSLFEADKDADKGAE